MNPIEVRESTIEANGISMRVTEAGEGPAVLLCHGWPELAYSWRKQMPALAGAGFRAIAPDMRGYGGTGAPEDVESYTILHLTGDMVGLLDTLGVETATIVGHDWGSMVAWNAALFRPDRFPSVVGVSVPFLPRPPMPPTDIFRAIFADRFFYILYFQEEGVAERELEADVAGTMRRVLFGASGQVDSDPQVFLDLPVGSGFLDALADPEVLPEWLGEEDLATYVRAFERTGFRGGLSWYRNLDRNWELTAPWQGSVPEQPALFIAGELDPVLRMPGGASAMEALLPNLHTVTIEGAGHWTQQEAPEEFNRALLEFLSANAG